MPESFRARLQNLALRVLPPYRTLVTGFAEMRLRLAAIEAIAGRLSEQAEAAAAAAAAATTATLDRAPQFNIRVQRGSFHWNLAPEDFAAFAFAQHDVLLVQPAEEAAKLPHIWDCYCIPCADGSSIRVPSTWRLHSYRRAAGPERRNPRYRVR